MQTNGVTSPPTSSPAAPASGTTNSSSALTSDALGDSNLFITLLTAELQAQDPTNPMSPEDMVSQLTEVSSLQQLISINQTLTSLAGTAAPTAGATASSTPAVPTAQTAAPSSNPATTPNSNTPPSLLAASLMQ